MTAKAETATALLGEAIARNRQEIERRWLERVRRDVVKTPGVELTLLRDGIPHYLDALVVLLGHAHGASLDTNGYYAWAKVAREHGITRVRIGFDIGQLIHEFIVLRHVIRELAVEHGKTAEGQEAILADLLDAAIGAAVLAYVEARDFEARRAEAENIGFLTHELRNPLSTAALSAARLRKTAVQGQEHVLDALERGLKRLAELIEGVLLTEKLEAGGVQSRPVELKLGKLMDEALESARANAGAKGIAFSASFDPDLTVRLDPALTRSALQNVVDNAVKYTDAGEVRVAVEPRLDELVFHVRDACHGLSEQELRTIFEPFRRGRTSKGGTGLGLAIARRAIEAQGGKIAAESPPATAGCHFWIALPRRA